MLERDERPAKRGTWADRGVAGFCAGPALGKCRSHKCCVPETGKCRTSDTVAFFPICCEVPLVAPEDTFVMAINDMKGVVEQPPDDATAKGFVNNAVKQFEKQNL